MDGVKDVQRDRLRDSADLQPEPPARNEAFSRLAATRAAAGANLFHGESEVGDNLLEGDALSAFAEILVRRTQGAAVFLCQLLLVDHGFKQRLNGS